MKNIILFVFLSTFLLHIPSVFAMEVEEKLSEKATGTNSRQTFIERVKNTRKKIPIDQRYYRLANNCFKNLNGSKRKDTLKGFRSLVRLEEYLKDYLDEEALEQDLRKGGPVYHANLRYSNHTKARLATRLALFYTFNNALSDYSTALLLVANVTKKAGFYYRIPVLLHFISRSKTANEGHKTESKRLLEFVKTHAPSPDAVNLKETVFRKIVDGAVKENNSSWEKVNEENAQFVMDLLPKTIIIPPSPKFVPPSKEHDDQVEEKAFIDIRAIIEAQQQARARAEAQLKFTELNTSEMLADCESSDEEEWVNMQD